MSCNYKTNIKDIQSKYTFKIFCAGDTSQIEQEIGDLSQLTTTAKDNLVNAINEVDGDLSAKEDKSNKVTTITSSSTDTQYPSAKLLYNQLELKENVANKTTTLSSSSTDTQYPSAKAVYDSQAEQDETISTLETNLEEAQEELDYYKTIYNVLPKASGNGESITLDNTGESILKLDTRGQCNQDSTTGNNLIDTRGGTTTTINGITFTPTYNSKGELQSINVNGTATDRADFIFPNYLTLQAGTYYLSKQTSNSVYLLMVDSGGSSYATSNLSESEFTLNANKSVRLWLRVFSGVSIDNAILYPMVATTSGATYEPFTYGASPNPNYPQQIHEVSGDNEIVVEGKNRLNKATCDNDKLLAWASGNTANETNSIASDYIRVNTTEQYSFTYWGQVMFYDKNKNYLGCLQNDKTTIAKTAGTTVKTLTVPSYDDIYYMRLGFRSNAENDNVNMNTANIMVNEGTTLLPYEPYNGDTYELSLGDIKMRGIGTYEDYFTKNSGKNLYNSSTSATGTISQSDGTTITPDSSIIHSDYIEVLSTNYIASYSGGSNITIRLFYYDESKTYLSTATANGTFIPISTAKYIRIQFNIMYNSNFMLEKNNQATTYEPYGTGQWCKHNAIGKGTITSVLSVGTTTSGLKYAMVEDNPLTELYGEALCSKYAYNPTQTNRYNTIRIISGGIYIYDERFTDTTTALSYINGLDYYFQLKTPYLSLIESTTLQNQLDKLEKALAKSGQTNISQVNNDAPFKIYASALKEIE